MPAAVANLLMLEMGLLDQEELRVVTLNTKNEVMGVDTVYKGSVNTAVVRNRRGAARSRAPQLPERDPGA